MAVFLFLCSLGKKPAKEILSPQDSYIGTQRVDIHNLIILCLFTTHQMDLVRINKQSLKLNHFLHNVLPL